MFDDVQLGPGGEFDLIRAMQRVWGSRARGIGDDAAVLDVRDGERLVASTDLSVELVHFRKEWLTPEEIGYRATSAALSDLAAMAARPAGLLIGLVLPDEWRSSVERLAEGIGAAASSVSAPIVGGDVSRGERLALSLTVLGVAARPAGRGEIAPGDFVYVTGRLGGPTAALRAWLGGGEPDAKHRERFARPAPRIAEAIELRRDGATAMIDISDGLASELRHLATAGSVALEIDLDRIPVFPGCTVDDAIRGGEEYELVVASPVALDQGAFARRFALPLSLIGRVQSPDDGSRSGEVIALLEGKRVDLGAGHDHFSR